MTATPHTQVCVQENQQTQVTQQSKIQIYSPCNDEVSDFWREKYEKDAKKYWDIFYKRHQEKVPPFLVRKVFTQIFSFINVQLFNSLLLRRECCSFSNGEYVKAGLAELEHWCYKATDEYAGTAWDELKHIRQAIGFLVTSMKTFSNGWK